MKNVFRFFILFVLAFCLNSSALAQEQEPKTIKIRKESNLTKVVFDNTELRLVILDRFGNPRENSIVSYKLYVKGKKETKEFEGYSNKLNPDMINYLNKLKDASKIFFTQISAKDDDEHLVKLPDVIEVWFPPCTSGK